MDNPFTQPVPDDTVNRVHALAHDLAWGCVYLGWHNRIQLYKNSIPERLLQFYNHHTTDEKVLISPDWEFVVPVSNDDLKNCLYDWEKIDSNSDLAELGVKVVEQSLTPEEFLKSAISLELSIMSEESSTATIDENNRAYVLKWINLVPNFELLSTFGYTEHLTANDLEHNPEWPLSQPKWKLTLKAFELLEKPAAAPNVFISYRRGVSTPFALYLESRLRLAGNNAVFVDKALEPGSPWRDELTEKIRQSKYFILLCTHGTFSSNENGGESYVYTELEIAVQSGCKIISILHPAGRKDFGSTLQSVLR